MNKTVQLVVALALLAGALYFYAQKKVDFNPVAARTAQLTLGKKTFGCLYDSAAFKKDAARQESPLVFFAPAGQGSAFTLGRFEKASEGKQGYGIRFGGGDITTVPAGGILYVDVNSKTVQNLPHAGGWNQKFLDEKKDAAELLRSTGFLD